MKATLVLACLTVCQLLFDAGLAQADTIAYWRFEEGATNIPASGRIHRR